MSCDTYEALRALEALAQARKQPGYVGDTGLYPTIPAAPADETVPMLPALLRPQAE